MSHRPLRPVITTGVAAALCLAWIAPSAAAEAAPAAPGPSATVWLSAATVEAPMTPPPQAGERTIGLQEIIATVLAHNPGLRQAQQASVSAQAAVRGAQVYANPRVEMQMGRNRARLPGTPAGSAQSWGVAQLIENPAARQARLEAAQANAQGSEDGIALTRNLLVSDTRALAAEYLLRRAEAEVLAEELALLEDVRERVRVRVNSGEAPRYEMIKADAEIVQARERVQTTRLQAEQVLVSLNRLAAGHLPSRWTVAAQLGTETEVPAIEALRQLVADQNPELRILRAELSRARAQTDGARASRWPGVEVRLGQSQEPDVRQTSIGLGVQVPLFDTRQAAVDEAASEVIRAEGRLEGRQAELQQELTLAAKSLELARLRVRALGDGVVKDAESALRVAQAAYKFGERGILEVLDAQRVLRAARMELIRARFQVQTALIDLDTLAGRHGQTQAQTPQP